MLGAVRYALFACVLVSACTAMQGGAQIPLDGGAEVRAFPGIISIGGRAEATTRRFIFNVHGMGCTTRAYNQNLIEALERYGFQGPASSPDHHPDKYCDEGPDSDKAGWVDIPIRPAVSFRGEGFNCDGEAGNHRPCTYDTFGSLRIDRLTHGNEELFVYTYFWHDDFWEVQRRYLHDDMRQHGRALINGALKRELMDQGLSDAVAYLSPLGRLSRQSIRVAICMMLKQASAEHPEALTAAELLQEIPNPNSQCLQALPGALRNTEFNFISHSLGSRMLFDALGPEQDSAIGARSSLEAATLVALGEHTRIVYMAANQLPLLGIGAIWRPRDLSTLDTPPAAPGLTTSETAVCLQTTFIYCRRSGARGPNSNPMDIVAFYDPDDLLGFRGDSGMIRPNDNRLSDRDVHFIDVQHRNANQWLGTLVWPAAAHDQEINRADSLQLILCGGHPDPQTGRLKSDDCRRRD